MKPLTIMNNKTKSIFELSKNILKLKAQLEKLGVKVNIELLNQEYVNELILKESRTM